METITCFRPHSAEYKKVMPDLMKIVAEHKANLVPGKPQLNYCDSGVMVSNPRKQFTSF